MGYLTAVALSRVILPDLKFQLIGSIGGSHGGDSEGGDEPAQLVGLVGTSEFFSCG